MSSSVRLLLLIVAQHALPLSGLLNFFAPPAATTSTAKPRFLILPGFGNDKIDYINPLQQGEPLGIVSQLADRGFTADVVDVQRSDWLNILRAVATLEFYRGQCRPEQLFQFYFDKTDAALRRMAARDGGDVPPPVLLGHSAGGWLARAMLADGRWQGRAGGPPSSALVSGLVTLGAPHLPPAPGAEDMTRGALRYVDEKFPGAFLSAPSDSDPLFYVSVAGAAVTANAQGEKRSLGKFAYDSYAQVTGVKQDGALGDGVVPLDSAHLAGAVQITLPDSFHSIQSNSWFGSTQIMDQWLPRALKEYEENAKARRTRGKRSTKDDTAATRAAREAWASSAAT